LGNGLALRNQQIQSSHSSLKKIDTSHPELYLEQNSEVKKSHERIHAFGNEDDENEAQ
jgi:hypothetical protein